MFPVSAKKLVQAAVMTKEGRKEGVTLFPLFTATGAVRQLVIVTQGPGKVSIVDWQQGLVFKPWIGPLVLNLSLRDLKAAEVEEARLATEYWHFDPLWLLAVGDLAQNRATPHLRASNLVAIETTLQGIMFRYDLSQVSWATEPTAEGVQLRNLSANPFPEPRMVPAEREKPLARSGGWVLRPFWER